MNKLFGYKLSMNKTGIRKLRKKKGLTQEQFASKIGVARLTVARWEIGTHSPSPMAQRVIKEVFGE